MKRMLKNEIGITLIALVVTIIVLIILAGISISLVLGDNGIITKAKQAKAETEQAKVNEETAINELSEILEKTNNQSGIEYAPYDKPYIPIGFEHIGIADWNSGYQIQEISTGNVFVWVPCVLEQSKVKKGDTVQTFQKTEKYNNGLGLSPTDTRITDLEPTNAIKTSVGTYGGFYIAAYEAGVPLAENGTEVAATSATTLQKARSVAGATPWNYITRTNSITAAENMIDSATGVKSGLISGEFWDTTLQWMVN